ncbi:DUF1878 family protein [Oceanobacillus sp. FSL H7-0719]|uniref:DUF1878 family protein n=1 Tax=Oceanobacillus sp. FSL H7-0719 TaxID=2954507 RepID=UPI00325211CB
MKEDNQSKASFQIQLLSKIIDMNKYPLIKIIIENNIDQDEYEDLFTLLERQNTLYVQQKEEGFLNFSSLLIEFAGMLNEKLNPDETIYALRKENYFPDLMDEFLKIIKEERAKGKRQK